MCLVLAFKFKYFLVMIHIQNSKRQFWTDCEKGINRKILHLNNNKRNYFLPLLHTHSNQMILQMGIGN